MAVVVIYWEEQFRIYSRKLANISPPGILG